MNKSAYSNMCALNLSEKLPDYSAEHQPLVLLVSHETDTRFLFRTLLEMWNYRVIEAESLEDSIYVAENRMPDLVLMDTSISFDDNLSSMKRLREKEQFYQTPFILLSGHSQKTYRQKALSLGADDFLVKPVDFDMLENSLKKNIKTKFFNNVTN